MSDATAHALEHHEPVTSTGIPTKKVLMWAFLGSDCMFFGTLISTHLIYRRVPELVHLTSALFACPFISCSHTPLHNVFACPFITCSHTPS